MEKLKGKHDHSLTKILKVLVFAIILLMPFLVFLPTGLYYGCNRKAENTNYVKTPIYQTKEVNGYDSMEINTLYKADYFNSNTLDNNIDFYIVKAENVSIYHQSVSEFMINNIEINNMSYYFSMDDLEGYYEINLGIDPSVDHYISIDFEKVIFENFYLYFDNTSSLNTFKSYCIDNGTGIEESDWNLYEYTPSTTITQSMSIAWEEMWDTPLFAWTNNTPFTATTNAFTNVFNISQASGFYNLIAYIITIVCIYLIIDIVIGIATMLTHMIAKQD